MINHVLKQNHRLKAAKFVNCLFQYRFDQTLIICDISFVVFQHDSVSSCSEPEDGEISTSDFESSDEDDADEAEGNVGTVSSLNLPTSCIRIVVTESSDDSLAVGKLFIVTCTGQLTSRQSN